MAETLLLDNNQDITLSELAGELDIAKGTIYKHFKSKNQLYLELIILNLFTAKTLSSIRFCLDISYLL